MAGIPAVQQGPNLDMLRRVTRLLCGLGSLTTRFFSSSMSPPASWMRAYSSGLWCMHAKLVIRTSRPGVLNQRALPNWLYLDSLPHYYISLQS